MALVAYVSVHACEVTLHEYLSKDVEIRRCILRTLAAAALKNGFQKNFNQVYSGASAFEAKNFIPHFLTSIFDNVLKKKAAKIFLAANSPKVKGALPKKVSYKWNLRDPAFGDRCEIYLDIVRHVRQLHNNPSGYDAQLCEIALECPGEHFTHALGHVLQ